MKKVDGADDRVDLLEKAIRFYLAKISQEELTEKQGSTQVALLTVAAEMEDIGDVVSKEIVALAKKKRKKRTRFSQKVGRSCRICMDSS